MNVRFRVGRVNAMCSEDDAVRLVAFLLDRETAPAARVAARIMVAVREQVLDAA
jgi:hypothetical protein